MSTAANPDVQAIAGILRHVPPPGRPMIAAQLIEAGVRYAPDETLNDLDRLRQIEAIAKLFNRLPAPARLICATDVVSGGGRLTNAPEPQGAGPKIASAFARKAEPPRTLGPEGDSPMRAALRLVNPDLFARVDAAEKARAEGNHDLAAELMAELRPKALAEFEGLRKQGAALKAEDFPE